MNAQLNHLMALEHTRELRHGAADHRLIGAQRPPRNTAGAVRTGVSRYAKRLSPALLRASLAMSPYTIPYMLYLRPQTGGRT